MYNEPIRKISGIAQIKYIKYYEKEYDDDFERIFKEKKEGKKHKEGKKQKIKSQNKKKYRNRKDCKDVQEIYGMEVLKTRDLKIYKKLDEKNKGKKLEHRSNPKLQVLKMMEAYNKSPKENVKTTIIEEEKDNKEKQSKKQEMEEFKKTLKAKEEYESAFEEFNRVLVKKNLEERKSKKSRNREHDR